MWLLKNPDIRVAFDSVGCSQGQIRRRTGREFRSSCISARDFHESPRCLVEEGAHDQAVRLSAGENVQQVAQRVRPVSTISSMTRTSMPWMSRSRSLEIRTTPGEASSGRKAGNAEKVDPGWDL